MFLSNQLGGKYAYLRLQIRPMEDFIIFVRHQLFINFIFNSFIDSFKYIFLSTFKTTSARKEKIVPNYRTKLIEL